MNNFIASLYDFWFNYALYKNLQDSVYNAYDFQKLGISLIIVSLLLLIFFYKFWDPVKKPRIKWSLILLIIGILMFGICYILLFNNNDLLIAIGNYSPELAEPNPSYFIFQMAAVSGLYGIILSIILSFIVKYISVSNKNNPF